MVLVVGSLAVVDWLFCPYRILGDRVLGNVGNGGAEMSSDNGGPAFPGGPNYGGNGLSLRDYFAAKVLAGTTSCHERMVEINNSYADDGVTLSEAIASECYDLADAMLAERNKEATP